MNALCAGGAAEHIRRVRGGSIQELVLIFPGALGDFLLALPTFRLLRHTHSAARTTLVVGGPLRGLARLAGVAEEIASLDDARTAWLFGGTTMPPWLTGRPAVYSWLGRDPTLGDRLALAAGSVRVLGVERGPGPEHASVSYARAAGVSARPAELASHARIAPPGSGRARALLAGMTRPVLAIHRGAGAPAKRWRRDGFAAVAAGWRRTSGSVIELLGPAEAMDDALADAVPARDWDLADVAALLGWVDVYAGNDGGVSHLAAAVGCQGVALFTSTDPARWAPVGKAVVAIGSGATGRETTTPPAIAPDRVLATLRRQESLTSSDPGSSVRA
jgi:glycosyl transferase family 9 (putative heptosyltransferase)